MLGNGWIKKKSRNWGYSIIEMCSCRVRIEILKSRCDMNIIRNLAANAMNMDEAQPVICGCGWGKLLPTSLVTSVSHQICRQSSKHEAQNLSPCRTVIRHGNLISPGGATGSIDGSAPLACMIGEFWYIHISVLLVRVLFLHPRSTYTL